MSAEMANSVARPRSAAPRAAGRGLRPVAGVLAVGPSRVSLAAISRAAGRHKDWLARHLCRLDPAAQAAGQQGIDRHDARWLPALRGLGFANVAGYLQARHARQH